MNCIALKALLLFGAILLSETARCQDRVKFSFNHACSWGGESINDSIYEWKGDNEAREMVAQICTQAGVEPNFTLMASTVPNACANYYEKIRYIYYNQTFIHEVVIKAKTKWAAYSILAHEVGHQVNFHTIDSSVLRRHEELIADQFSGMVLRRLGASLKEAQGAINCTEFNDNYKSFYPEKSARLAAIAAGWVSGGGLTKKTYFSEQIDSTNKYHYGGKKYCNFYMQYKNVHFFIQLSPSYHLVSDSRIDFNAVETNRGCPWPQEGTGKGLYVMDKFEIKNDTVSITYAQDPLYTYHNCTVTFLGVIEKNENIEGILTIHRIDLDEELNYNINLPFVLEAQSGLNNYNNKRDEEHSSDDEFAVNAITLFDHIPFGSTINDITASEFGAIQREAIKYESLPIARECDTEEIRYFWRRVKDSRIKNTVYSILEANGLRDEISDVSYILYGFAGGKFCRMAIRLYTSDDKFYTKFMRAMGRDINGNKPFRTSNGSNNYFISTYVDGSFRVTDIIQANSKGAQICWSHDWWH